MFDGESSQTSRGDALSHDAELCHARGWIVTGVMRRCIMQISASLTFRLRNSVSTTLSYTKISHRRSEAYYEGAVISIIVVEPHGHKKGFLRCNIALMRAGPASLYS